MPAASSAGKTSLAQSTKTPGGHVVEDRRLERVDAAVAEVGECLGGRRLLLEAGDAPVGVVHDDAVERRVGDLLDGQCGDAAVGAVRGHEGREVDVGEAVAADHDEGAAGEQLAERAHPAGRAQQLLLEVVAQLDAEGGAVAEVARGSCRGGSAGWRPPRARRAGAAGAACAPSPGG